MLSNRKLEIILKQIGLQLFLLFVTLIVLFPIVWIFSLALDPRNIDKPLTLTLIPPGASFNAFRTILFEPFNLLCKDPGNPDSCMTFVRLLKNSLLVALGTSLFSVILGASAAYAFSRFNFIGRQAGMLGFIVLLMLPSTATLAPLYVLLSSVQMNLPESPLAISALWLFILSWLFYYVWRYDITDRKPWYAPVRWVLVGLLGLVTFFALVIGLTRLQPYFITEANSKAALLAVVALISSYLIYRTIIHLTVEHVNQLSKVFLVVALFASISALLMVFVPMFSTDSNRESLRTTLLGLAVAYTSGSLPFAVWNLKGYFDTVPKELEEAALIDGASVTQTFIQVILPLSVPALAVTVLFSFMTGWTEFVLAWTFLEDPSRFTLAMALRSMQGQFATPWSQFAAMSILMSVPIVFLFFVLQRYIVSGLTVGGVKG